MSKNNPSTSSLLQDESWLDQLQSQDPAAFERLFETLKTHVWAVAIKVLKNREQAEEATQQTFIKVWQSIETFRRESKIETWVISIAFNVSRKMLARAHSGQSLIAKQSEIAASVVQTGAASESIGVSRSSEAWTGSRAATSEERLEKVYRAVQGLPPRQQEVVKLKVLGGLTHEQVASTLSVSVGTVKAHLHQALANLRKYLKQAPQQNEETA